MTQIHAIGESLDVTKRLFLLCELTNLLALFLCLLLKCDLNDVRCIR